MNNVLDLLAKLDELYDKEEKLKNEINRLIILYKQLQESKSMLEQLIMFSSNTNKRRRDYEGIRVNTSKNR